METPAVSPSRAALSPASVLLGVCRGMENEKTHLPSSFAHPHPGCITAPLRLDYTNVLFTPPRSRLRAPNPPFSTVGCCLRATLWKRVILWYCAGINMKSHYGLLDRRREGGRMVKGGVGCGWRDAQLRLHLVWDLAHKEIRTQK